MQKYQIAIARIFLALVFLGIVILKLTMIVSNPEGYQQYQATLGQFGLPAIFAPLLILIQLLGSLALLVGFKTKLAANLLAALALFLALVLGRMIPDVLFLYIGIAGGMLLLSALPSTPFSIDGLKK